MPNNYFSDSIRKRLGMNKDSSEQSPMGGSEEMMAKLSSMEQMITEIFEMLKGTPETEEKEVPMEQMEPK